MKRKILLLCVLAVLLSGCVDILPSGIGEEPSPTATPVPPTATPTAIPTYTPTPTAIPPTNTPTPTPVPPTSTPRATATPRPMPPTPTSTPTLQGRFVFQVASGGDIYRVKADGTNLTRLTSGLDPSWSPDGGQIAFSRWTTPWGIYTINADGGNEMLVFSSSVARSPVWSPDGRQIAFYFETEGMTAPWKECIAGYGCPWFSRSGISA